MKKTKLYAKKTLSVLMAVMMLMSAWVFVAPEKASAASSYPVTINFDVTNKIDNGGHILVRYYEMNADGSVNYNAGLKDHYITTSLTGSGCVNVKNGYSLSSNVPGWPYEFSITTKGGNLYMTSFYIGNINVLNGWVGSTDNTTKTWRSGMTVNNITMNWPEPAVSSVRSAPVAQTISVPKTGSASKTFTATFNDQYGMQWPSTSGMSVALSPALSGATATISGNTATVKADLSVFNNAAYNSSNGEIKTVLQIIQNNKIASCDVTFKAPQYNVYLNNFAGNTVKTFSNIGYYNQQVSLSESDLPANTPATEIDGNDNYHQPYEWDVAATQAFNIMADTTFKEIKSTLANNPEAVHNYGAWVVSDDSHSRTCSVCGHTQTMPHTIDSSKGYVTKDETCTEDGVMTYDCSVCGKVAIKTETIDKITGHDFTGDWAMKEDGKNGSHYQKCLRCDAYGYGGVENNSCPHDWCKLEAAEVVTAATCTDDGIRKYTCSKCPATYTEEIPATGHPYDKINKTAAKNVANVCGGDGNAEFWTCTVCNRVYTDSALTAEITDYTDADADGIPDVLETKGPEHNFTGTCVNASNGADGTHYYKCTRCSVYGLMVDGKPVIGATEKHSFSSKTSASTCTTAGKITYTCSGCNHTYSETLPLAAHTMETIDAVTATCTTGGNNKYYKCTACSQYFKDEEGTQKTTVADEKISALGHTFVSGGDVEDPTKDREISPATCVAAAVYAVTCDRCGLESASGTYSYGSPDTVNGHKFAGEIQKNPDGTHSYKCLNGCETYGSATPCNYEVTEDTASTCSTAGHTTYECTVCGNGYSETKALDLDNHEGEGTKTVGALEAMCNSNGYTGNIHCLGCDAVIEKGTFITADPKVHPHANMKDYEAKVATCQDPGYSAYRYCDQCGTYEIEKVPGTLKAHKFTKYVSNGDGTHTAVCDTCDAAVATPATETKDCAGGKANCVDKAICSTCGGAYGDVDSTNHKTPEFVAKVDSTCQKEGTEAYYRCTACNTDMETPVVIAKKDHIYGAWTKLDGQDKHTRSCTTCVEAVAPVATETADCNGGSANCLEKAKCVDCKAEYGSINPDVHKTTANTLKDVVPATCQAPGFSGNYRYDCCNEIKEAGTATEQLAHTFDIEVEGSRVAATCIAKGEVTYKCSTCVESEGVAAATQKKELAIDAKNHATPDKTVTINQKAATCEEDGHTGDIYYECCYDETKTDAENRKALKEKGTVIKANGQHVYAAAIPEYMIERIDETKDEEGKVTSRTIVVKDEAPDYEGKIAFRHGDNKWYHVQQCTICNVIVYNACYTYAHTYNCVETDTCEVCDGLCSLTDENKHKADLVEITDGAVEATCIADGKKSYYKCADCGKTYFDEAGKSALDLTSEADLAKLVISKETVSHKWDEGTETEGTCGTPGKIAYKCTVDGCNATKEISTGISSQNHTWKADYEVTKEPTCHSVGYKVIKCEVCDSVKPNSAITIAATGEHDFDANKDGKVDRNDAVITDGENCQKPGTLTFTCQNEGCTYTKTETDTEGISAHSFGEWVSIGGDCSTGVVQERVCTVCGTKEHQTLTTDTHELVVFVRVEPTPEKDGYVIYECANCKIKTDPVPLKYEGEEPSDEHIIDASQYRTVKEATCAEAEKREYTCLRCGEKVVMYYGELKAHYWLEQPAEIATCDRAGHNAYYRCVRCLEEYGRVNYEPLGHADNDGDGKCDECNSAFYGQGNATCGCMCHKEGWFMQIIYKIVNFFWKLFKINPSCACGATHY